MKKYFDVGVLIVAIAAWACVGCMDVKDADEKKPEEAVRLRASTHFVRPGDPVALPLPDAHKYQIVFPANESGTVLVERETTALTNKGETKKVSIARMLPVVDGKAVDTEVEEGVNYVYRWGDVVGTKIENSEERSLTVPRDIVVSGEMDETMPAVAPLFATTAAETIFGRLVFDANSVLVTNGKSLKLRFATVLSRDGVIRTFPAGSVAPSIVINPFGDGKNIGLTAEELATRVKGRAGGDICLSAERASGRLSFEMRGEAGGGGPDGPKADARLKGAKGQQGDPGASAYAIPAPAAGQNCAGILCSIPQPLCTKQPGPGRDGSPGQAGFQGGRGGRGGNTGHLNVRINDASDFTWDFVREPGSGGPGGIGGEGGNGGDPGDPGREEHAEKRVAEFRICPLPEAAHPGPQGPRGDHGDRGGDGEKDPVCEWRDNKMNCN